MSAEDVAIIRIDLRKAGGRRSSISRNLYAVSAASIVLHDAVELESAC